MRNKRIFGLDYKNSSPTPFSWEEKGRKRLPLSFEKRGVGVSFYI
jgi:hypothetical protein